MLNPSHPLVQEAQKKRAVKATKNAKVLAVIIWSIFLLLIISGGIAFFWFIIPAISIPVAIWLHMKRDSVPLRIIVISMIPLISITGLLLLMFIYALHGYLNAL